MLTGMVPADQPIPDGVSPGVGAGEHDRPGRPETRARAGKAAALVGATWLLGGCLPMQEQAAPPTAVIPELVIVTPTVGVPVTPEPVVTGRYTVQPGDTLSGIAARFGVSEAEIMAVNDLADRDRLFAGQVLAIPAPTEAAP